jgi:hypothetical protein
MKRPTAIYLTSIFLTVAALADWFGRKGALYQPAFILALAIFLLLSPRFARWPVALTISYIVCVNFSVLILYWLQPSPIVPPPDYLILGARIGALTALAYLGFQILFGRKTRSFLAAQKNGPNQTAQTTPGLRPSVSDL